MTGARFVWTMAWRETRASRRRLSLLIGAVAIGVAALVAINAFTDNLRVSIRDQARSLLGADLSFSSRRPLPDRVDALVDSLTCRTTEEPCGASARVVTFAAMGYVPRTEGTRLVRVEAVRGDYPFYGEIRTDPAGAWRRLQGDRQALVDPALLTTLGAAVGDTLALGTGRFVILGTVLNVPGDVGIGTAFGPRVFVPEKYLEETNLLRFGSRAQYTTYVRLDRGDTQPVADAYRPLLRGDRVSVRTVEESQRNLNESLSRLGRYLGLVALIALLLGGLGVASAVHVFIRQKLDTIAVLRCLGATARQVFAIYLVQAAALGLIGSAIGVVLGLGIQLLIPQIVRDFLPVDVRVTPSWGAIWAGLGVGTWVALIFALRPLLAIRGISPLEALRRPYEEAARAPRDLLRPLAAVALALSVAALAILQAESVSQGLGFTAAIGIAVGVLWLASLGLIRGVRRWFPSRFPYVWRQGLANLYRPANQTVTVVLALGFGAYLLGTLYLLQHNLLRDLRIDAAPTRPNILLFDIQPDQRDGLLAEFTVAGHTPTPFVPIVPMRISEVEGRPVFGPAAGDSAAPGQRRGGWAFRREYRSTYRDTLVRSERLVAGDWWDPAVPRDPGAPAPVSAEASVAEELGVGVGDEIVWDVQGVPVRTRVASLREVDWARFETNFYFVFPSGVLEAAPQIFVTLSRIEDAGARAQFQRRLVERYPNVTALDLSLVQQALDRIIGHVVLAVRFMAIFSLATGAVVLIGAVATSRFQRIREAVLLKTLGATSDQVARVVLAEYLALGVLACAAGLLLAIGAAWALTRFVFESSFAVPALQLLGLSGAIVLLTVLVGLWNSTEVFRKTPLEVLRAEE